MAEAKLSSGKAPGVEGVPDLVIKAIINFKAVFITYQIIYAQVCRNRQEQPSSYRPICLLNAAGKLFERLLKKKGSRLTWKKISDY